MRISGELEFDQIHAIRLPVRKHGFSHLQRGTGYTFSPSDRGEGRLRVR